MMQPKKKGKKASGKKRPTASKDTTVTTGAGKGAYGITVKKKSPYAKLAKKMGSVPSSFRAGTYTAKTDPWKSGISPAEKKKRATSYGTKSTYKKSSRK
jgi:hypothetical protein